MKITHAFGSQDFKPGSFWKECERCGFDTRVEDLKKDGVTKALVCKECYDAPNPLDKGRK